MKLELQIGDDKEIRSFIKDCIKGEVLSIIRTTAKETLIECLTGSIDKANKNINDVIKSELERVIKDEVKKAVKKELELDNFSCISYIKKYAKELVEGKLRDFFDNHSTKIIA